MPTGRLPLTLFAEILRFFGIAVDPAASVYAKAEAVAARLREERVLLILDGVGRTAR